jgi:hypothetical protein
MLARTQDLTTGVQSLTGTDGNDVFRATYDAINDGDAISAGEGTMRAVALL